MNTLNLLRIFLPTTVAFLFGIGFTPFLTHVLYKYKMWKPKAGKFAMDGTPAEVFNRLHKEKEVGTPRFGGVIVWGSVLATAGLMQALWVIFPGSFDHLAFISRNQTWLPLSALLIGALAGFLDDLYEVRGAHGLRLRTRLFIVALAAFACGLWFYTKLGVSTVSVPGGMPLMLGPWFLAVFVAVALFLYAGGVIDGLDGLAGGVFATTFSAYAGIAFFQHQYDISAFAGAVAGALLAFLWFNIPPARFYLSETGTMGLTLALTVVAFLTDALGGGRGVVVLPVIALPLVATVLSNIVQVAGKKLLGRKLFRIAPLHHHFEALGWPSYKVTMRYWIVGTVAAIIGMILALL